MTCGACGREMGDVSVRLTPGGDAELINGYGGLVGRLRANEPHELATTWCVACEEPAASGDLGPPYSIMDGRSYPR